MNDEHRRKTIRLQNYDYGTNGAYHITLCTKNRAKVLSRIVIVGRGFIHAVSRYRGTENPSPAQVESTVASLA